MSKRRNKNYERGSNYRKTFFSKNKHFRYRCAYCGKRLKEEDVEVDHLIPVGAAKNKLLVRVLLNLCGIHNVNDEKNLVSACRKCNRKKSDKMGLWVIRGAIGRHRIVWILRDVVVAALLFGLGYFLLKNYIETGLFWEWIEKLRAMF